MSANAGYREESRRSLTVSIPNYVIRFHQADQVAGEE